MSTFIVAVICGAVCTALGIWVGRRNPKPRPLSEAEKLIPVFPAGGYPSGSTRVSDLKSPPPNMCGPEVSRILLGWCIAAQHADCPYETESRTHPGVRLRCTCTCGHLGVPARRGIT